MTFYFKPPHGALSLADVENMAWRRLNFLMDVAKSSHSVVSMRDLLHATVSQPDADCLIEGSQKDSVSHFLLRLACSQEPEMAKFFISAETQLFTYRFSCMTADELYSCVKPLRRFVRQASPQTPLCKQYRNIVTITTALTASHTWSSLIAQFLGSESSGVVRLPFEFVCDLVGRRLVVLDRGVAMVPCGKLCDVMTTVFRLSLEWGMTLAHRLLPSVIESDTRISRLFRKIKVYLRHHQRSYHPGDRFGAIHSEDIDQLVTQFPPCMTQLHNQLRLNHRLHHHNRIAYTLYLKELGLPLHEALQFWSHEYSQPTTHSCEHRWEKDSKRYTYNIRHLYGLEGARINYRAHCCTAIQSRGPSGMDGGGCPFKHYDKSHLIDKLSLSGLSLDATRAILLANQNASYNHACHLYLHAKLQKNSQKIRYEPNPTSKNSVTNVIQSTSYTTIPQRYSSQLPTPRTSANTAGLVADLNLTQCRSVKDVGSDSVGCGDCGENGRTDGVIHKPVEYYVMHAEMVEKFNKDVH